MKEERKVRKEAEKTRVDKRSAELVDKIKDNEHFEDLKKATLEAAEQVANAKK